MLKFTSYISEFLKFALSSAGSSGGTVVNCCYPQALEQTLLGWPLTKFQVLDLRSVCLIKSASLAGVVFRGPHDSFVRR